MRSRVEHALDVRAGARLEARADRVPIFVLGAPRSGTTLLYQLLVEGLDIGWLANAHAEHPSRASTIERRQRPRAARDASDWESNHGRTHAAWGPSEAEGFWYRALPRRPHQLDARDVTPERTRALRAMVRRFADACGRPVVFKNVIHTLRIPVLDAALPEARFVWIERDLADNARSLLAGRITRGDANAWWSAEPRGHDLVQREAPASQVTWQVERMREVALPQLAELGSERVLHVTYDELCRDPRGVLDRVRAWLVDGGVEVHRRPDAHVPERFGRRGGTALPDEHERALVDAIVSASAREDAT